MAPDASADAARRAAASILSEGRFHSPSVPRPLHGVLHGIGVALREAGRAIARAVNGVGTVVPGGSPVVWVLLGVAVVAGCWWIAKRYSGRLLLEGPREAGVSRHGGRQRAAALEREAERAEREGRYAEAVRLRFRAGLARLAERDVIRTARSITTGEVSRAVGSPDFDALARRFDEIAYGGADAERGDAEEARHRWPQVLRGAERS